MRRVKPANQHRLESGYRQVAAIGLGQTGDVIAREAHAHLL